ncbi:hypothetical protein [Lunatimonas salinarum]|uniref:hypothetical protein n=1 Tax=Lunatimonas salinarum TaxID=1774590 RepID=UPI001AE05EEC|nr:hypothetical protein [Lunatimonas salinarum]
MIDLVLAAVNARGAIPSSQNPMMPELAIIPYPNPTDQTVRQKTSRKNALPCLFGFWREWVGTIDSNAGQNGGMIFDLSSPGWHPGLLIFDRLRGLYLEVKGN